ncbi:MAG TPA: hypothetical protein VK477_02475, partial [Acidobacteriota bacterium]|nr:hypothetical protein [Acidobacteriota bacterium]
MVIAVVFAAALLTFAFVLLDIYQRSSIECLQAAQRPAEDLIYRQEALGALRLSWEAVSGFTQALVAIVGTVLSLLSLLLAFLVLYWDKTNERRLQCREIYQRLELASVELFRFECDHDRLVELLWGDGEETKDSLPRLAGADAYQVRAYVCQMLNLFEMALRFRRDETMEPEVFGSWVIWMHDLCSCPRFQTLWPDLRLNYVAELRHVMDAGIAIAAASDIERRTEFFKIVAA